MKIIDEKGRLFGKINVIDFLVILFLFCLVPMFYFGYKIFHKPTVSLIVAPRVIPLDLYCRINNLTPEELKLISAGDIFLDDSGNNIGEVLSVGKPDIYSYNVDLGGGNIIPRQDPNRRQVLIKARILGEIKNDVFYYRGEKVSIGSKISLKTNKYSTEGLIESEPKSTPYTYLGLVELNIYLKPIEPNDLKLISTGDIFLDDYGNNIGEVLSVGKLDIYSYNVDLGGGNIIPRQDPNLKQVLIKARILGEIKNDALYYKGEKVSIGSKISLKTNKYSVEGLIESEPKYMFYTRLELVELNIHLKPIDPKELKLVSVGDIFLDEAGNNIGEILNLGEPAIYSYNVDLGGGNIIPRQDPNLKQVLIKARILGEIKNDALYYRGEKVSIGSKVSLKTNKYRVEGLIESEPKYMLSQKVLLKVRFKDLIPEIANIINIGDEGKDEKGDIISKVKSIISNDSSQMALQMKDDEVIIASHPINRDIVLLIEARCNKDGDRLFFEKNNIVKVGKNILLMTNKYDITGTIISIDNN